MGIETYDPDAADFRQAYLEVLTSHGAFKSVLRGGADDDVLRFEVRATVPPITPIVVQAPAPYMEAPVINIPETVVNVAAPIVNVAPTDLRPLRADMAGLRTDMADLRAEIRKPRTKRLVRDQLGNIVGSEDVVE